jgi:hypothetical protein
MRLREVGIAPGIVADALLRTLLDRWRRNP